MSSQTPNPTRAGTAIFTSTSQLHRVSGQQGLSQNSSSGSSTCGIDNDTLCSYSTNKVVVIRSWKLGMLSNFIKIAVLCYISWQIYVERGYMILEQVDDSGVRSSVYSGSHRSHLPDYCCNCSETTGFPIEPYKTGDSAYDRGYHSCKAINGKPGACCAVSDTEGVRLVYRSPSTVSIASNFHFLDFQSSCSDDIGNNAIYPVNPQCKLNTVRDGKNTNNFYTMGIEDFTLGLIFSLSAPRTVLSDPIPMKMMIGELHGVNGEVLRRW